MLSIYRGMKGMQKAKATVRPPRAIGAPMAAIIKN
jgi:hypothetical protein